MIEFLSLHWWTDSPPPQATQTGSDELKEIFESHLVEAGRMLVLLDTIVSGAYVMEVRSVRHDVTVTVWVKISEYAGNM